MDRPRGPVGLARHVVASSLRDDAPLDASAMAFSLFLAMIPLLGLLGAVAAHALHAEPEALALVSRLLGAAPEEVRAIAERHVTRGSEQAVAPWFLAGSVWFAANAFQDAMTVFERAAGAARRTWLTKRALALGCVLVLLASLVGGAAALLAAAGGAFPLLTAAVNRVDAWAPSLGAELGALTLTTLLVGAFFRVAVPRPAGSRPRLVPGAAFTVAVGSGASLLFASYAEELARYAAFYGSLAAVAVVLLWLWIVCLALLVGFELNVALDRARPRARGAPSVPEG